MNALDELEEIKDIVVLFKTRNTIYMGGEKSETFNHKNTIGNEFKEVFEIVENALLKAQEKEKENELLKEIIKSFFDRGCPLHQYTDKEGTLLIEIDDECSTMHLGEFKGVDLDKYLKEVLE